MSTMMCTTWVIAGVVILSHLLSPSFGQGSCGPLNIKAADTGELASPNYNRSYPANLYCEYTVTVSAGVLILTVVQVDLEESNTCSYDYLQIFNYFTDTPVTNKMCKPSDLPSTTETSSNSLKIVFKSDHSNTGTGWKIRWRVKSGTDIRCGWAPMVRNAVRTQLGNSYGDITRYVCERGFELVGIPNITCQIRGSWSSAPECNKLSCGTPPNIANATITVSSTYVGDMATYNCDKGYNMTGKDVVTCRKDGKWSDPPECYTCGNAILRNGSWTLTSPNYPSQYSANSDCKWTITVSSGKLILNITDFDVEPRYDCGYDVFGIVDSFENTTIIDKKCGTDDGFTVVPCLSNTVTVFFRTDSSVQKRGWSLTWWGEGIMCGAPPDVSNSIRTVSGLATDDQVTYTCDPELVPVGDKTLYCQANGRWTSPPTCQEPSGLAAAQSKPSDSASVNMGLLGVVIVAIIVLIVCVVGISMREVNRRRIRNRRRQPSNRRNSEGQTSQAV